MRLIGGPGVLLKARKPMDWRPADLNGIALYSVVLGERVKGLVMLGDAPLVRRLALYLVVLGLVVVAWRCD